MIVALCGGVGGSKLLLGLYRSLPPNRLAVVVNTADDLELWGLHISPDLDTVLYTLAGLARSDVGWGIEGDTTNALDMFRRYGAPSWFSVGDRDLATDIIRTAALRSGASLTEVTHRLARSLGVQAEVFPASDDRIQTRLLVNGEWLEFEEYFVHRRHQDSVDSVRYEGVEAARASTPALAALQSAEAVILVNSNPVLSILPILSIPGIADALRGLSVPRVAVTPFVGGNSVTGPAGRLMQLVHRPATPLGLAHLYREYIDAVVLDYRDDGDVGGIESMGLRALTADTVMQTTQDKVALASAILDFIKRT